MIPDSVFLNLSITSCLIFFIIPYSNGSKVTTTGFYNLCSSLHYSCGPINSLGYPFWGEDRPEYCGQREFKLSCWNNNTSLHFAINIADTSHLKLRKITPSSHTLLVHQYDNELHTCGRLDNGPIFTVMSPFKLGANVGKLRFFTVCPNLTSGAQHCKRLSCPSYDHTSTKYYYFDKSQAELGNQSKYYNASFEVPVFKTGLDELNHGKETLESVLEKGFELKYTVTNFTACLTCQNNGGTCGSSGDPFWKFRCFYPGKRNSGLTLGLGITGGTIIIALVAFFLYRKKFKSSHSRSIWSGSLEPPTSNPEEVGIYFHVPLFSYRELEQATSNFDPSKELGSGGFGRVYYGKVSDGREVAVKRLYEESYRRVDQFMNEVKILTALRHQNLVSLYGCTSPNSLELFLVYEYVPNGTVSDHLYGIKSISGSLPWHIRTKIAIETAIAVSYLHLSDIIHRDVKTNNILLDNSFGVKVADFGLSRLFPNDVTHVSTAPQGTPGYVDPEYHQCYQLTKKSDVYSFGVVLIELLSSLPAVDTNRQRHEINLSSYAINRIKQCAFDELVDPKLGFERDFKVRRMTIAVAELAFQCLQHDKDFRPTMDEVLEGLTRIQSADYEALEMREKYEVNDGIMLSSKLPPSPKEIDGARLLDTHQKQLRSPSSVMHIWHSTSTESSTCKNDVKFITPYQTI